MAKLAATLILYDKFSSSLNKINSALTRTGNSMTTFGSKASQRISNGPGEQMQKEAQKTDQAFNRMQNGANKTGSIFKSVLGANIVSSGISKGMGVIKDSIGSAVQRFDTLQSYPRVMKQMDFSTVDTAKSMKVLKSGVDGLPTSLQDLTKSAQSFAIMQKSATGGAKTATALNDAFLASGASAGDASRGVQQYSQMLATGTVDMQSWRTLQETMPYALTKVANSFGLTGKSAEKDLYAKLKNGEITMDQLNDRFVKLDGGAKGFAKTARTAGAGIGTSFTNMRNSVTNGLASTIEAFDKGFRSAGTGGLAKMLDGGKNAINSFFKVVNGVISAGIPKIVSILKSLSPIIGTIGSVIKAMAPVAGMFVAASGGALAFSKAMSGLNAAKGFLKANWVLVAIFAIGTALVWAYQNVDWFRDAVNKAAQKLAEFGSKIGDSLGKLSGFKLALVALAGVIGMLAIAGLVRKLMSMGKGLMSAKNGAESMSKSTGKASSATNSLKKGLNSLMKSAGIALIIASLALLAAAMTPLAKTGTEGAVAMLAFGAAVSVMAAVLGAMGTKLETGMGGIIAFAASVSVIALAMTPLASTGMQGAIAMAAFGAVVAGLVVVFAIFGPALTAASVGMLIFGVMALLVGAAVMLIGTGIMLAMTGLTMFAMVLPIVAAIGTQAAMGIALIGLALFIVGPAALIASIGLGILAVALVILGVGAILAGAGMMILGMALMLVSVFGMVAAVGILMLGVGLTLVFMMSMMGAMGMLMLGVSITMVAMMSMMAAMSIQMVATAVMMLFSVVSSIFASIVAAVSNAMGNVVSAVQNGMSRAIAAVKNVGSSMISAGTDFVMGFVNGIRGAISQAAEAAASMAKAAVSAAKSFLKIHSPSRVMRDDVGRFVAEGMAVGISKNTVSVTDSATNMAKSAVDAASVFSLPTIGGMTVQSNPGQLLADGFLNAISALQTLIGTLKGVDGTSVDVTDSRSVTAPQGLLGTKHGNSDVDNYKQEIVVQSCAIQINADSSITGEEIAARLESFIQHRQDANLSFGG